MKKQFVLDFMPDRWMYRMEGEQFADKYDFVRNKMVQFLMGKNGKEGNCQGQWSKLVARYYHMEETKAATIFHDFCTVIAQALLFKELHRYLFPYGRSNTLWRNSVLSKLTGKTDREMFFLMAKNMDLLNESKNLA